MTAAPPPIAPAANPASLPLPSRLFGRPVFYGWYIVALAFITSMMSSGVQAYGMGTFVKPMTQELGWSRTDISLGQTASTAVMGVIGLFIGGFIDRRGGRLLVVIGAVLSGLGYLLFGHIHELWQFYVVKAGIQTVGQAGMGALVVNVSLSNWFIRRRGRAIAFAAMGNSAAALVLPSLAQRLIDAFGWRQSWTYIGLSVWIVVIPLSWLILRRRPEDHGLEPDGGRVEARPGDRLTAQRMSVDGVRWTRREAMRTPALWLLILTFGLGSMGVGSLLLHLIPFLTDSGYSGAQAAGAFSMIGVSGLLSKPLWGMIADRVASRFAATAEFVLLGFGVLAIMLAPTLPLMYAAIFLYGIGIGGVVTLQETVWADYFGRLTIGMVRSIGRPFTIVSSAGGPVLAGLAYDIGGSYHVALVVFIGAYVVAAVLIFITPAPKPPLSARAMPLPEPRAPTALEVLIPAGDNGYVAASAQQAPPHSNGTRPRGAGTARRSRDYMNGGSSERAARRDYMRADARDPVSTHEELRTPGLDDAHLAMIEALNDVTEEARRSNATAHDVPHSSELGQAWQRFWKVYREYLLAVAARERPN